MKLEFQFSWVLIAIIFCSLSVSGNVFAQEEFKTNSGESFKDPFADPDAPSEVPSNPPAPPAPESESQPLPGPDEFPGEPAATPAPAPVERLPPPPPLPPAPTQMPVPEPVVAPSPKPTLPSPSDFDFPEMKEPKGPRTEDIDPVRALKEGTKVGTWNLGFDLGAGTNFNRRPNQFHFELEGGYRLYENFDLNGIIEMRFMKDRILGFYVIPNYSWRMTPLYKTYRIDLRAGLGTGWVFRGYKGSTYQTGYFPIRTSGAAIFYPGPRWAFVVSLDLEVFLVRVDSDGKSRNEISHKKGPPTQLIPSVGIRWEF